jgi:DNA-binding transcriptional ArsR family regulator
LQRILGVSQVQVSKHLALLREAELVTCHTHRQQRIYTLESEPGPAIGPVLQAVDQVALLEPQLRRDRERASALRPIPVPKAHVLQESETSLPSRLL